MTRKTDVVALEAGKIGGNGESVLFVNQLRWCAKSTHFPKTGAKAVDEIPDPLLSAVDTSKSTSESLLEKVRRGEPDSWDRLVRLYSPVVYAKLRKRGLSESDAADVSQNVFLKVHRSLEKFQRDPPNFRFRKWLATVVRNAFLDFVKSEGKKHKGAGGTDANQLLNQAPDLLGGDSFEEESERTLLVRQALKIIEGDFQPNTWSAFWLMSVDEMSSQQVASKLGMTAAGVRKAKERVTGRLLETLNDEFQVR